ncbi:MAG: hypothetical protein U5R30_03160 [Deltaproteobacteria bacterium]|nr:hypothetical protein [Deltaproteobacteria bacterium]
MSEKMVLISVMRTSSLRDARIDKTEVSNLPPVTPVNLLGHHEASVDILSAQLTLNF